MNDYHPSAHAAGPSRTIDDTPADPASLTRSREQLVPKIERVPVTVARLEKFLVTEQRTITVNVTREDVRLVYDTPQPTEIGPSTSTGQQLDATPASVTLFAETVDVVRRWVPVETATLEISTVNNVHTVTGTVRTEHIDTMIEPNNP